MFGNRWKEPGTQADFFYREFAIGEIEKRPLIIDHGFHGDVVAPQLLDILQRLFSVLQLQIAAVVVMLQ